MLFQELGVQPKPKIQLEWLWSHHGGHWAAVMKYDFCYCRLFSLLTSDKQHFFSHPPRKTDQYITTVFIWQEAAELAGWEDEQIEFIREKVSEEGKREDLKKGKAPEQVATLSWFTVYSNICDALPHCVTQTDWSMHMQVVLDEAAFLMDLASVDGNWDDVVDRIAGCYREAGLDDIAKFIAYRE